MKRRIAGYAALVLLACAAFGCDRPPSAEDPNNKVNVLKNNEATATSAGDTPAPSAPGKGFTPGEATTPPPPAPK